SIPASGGTRRRITSPDSVSETTHRFPRFLPDGQHFIYLSANHQDPTGNSSSICYASLDGKEPRRLFASKSSAIYAQGFLLFVADSTLMAQEFDPEKGELKGSPRTTREVVQLDRSTWNAAITAGENGLLVYGLGGRAGNCRLAWYNRSGARIKHLSAFGNYLTIDLSPDDRRLVVEWQQTPLADDWIFDVQTGTRSRLTTNPDDETSPMWMANGIDVAYAGRQDSKYRIFIKRADGSGEARLFLEDPKQDVWPLSASRDGKWLAFGKGITAGTPHGSLWMAPLVGDGEPRMLVPASDVFQGANFSPDGKWIAFGASVSGRSEVYVGLLPSSGDGLAARWQVSSNGGDRPRWRNDGRELYYVRPDCTIMAVSVDGSGEQFRVTGETPLFQAFQRIIVQTMDVTGDGQHFLINRLGGDEGEALAVVTNWLQTLPR
ncbi:MAG TPA: hypothetical protein VFU38_03820, partial [Candidatus Krumholzibacteria bacterium]|nr:hypothetical protein [Candidatus Krumholzibacteria bacterium]